MAKHCLGSTNKIPTKKMKQIISHLGFLICSLLLLVKLLLRNNQRLRPKPPQEVEFVECESFEDPHQAVMSHIVSDGGSMMRTGEKEWISSRSGIGSGGEGMDKLWEVYEMTEEEEKKKKKKQGESFNENNKSRILDYLEEQEEEEEVASLCCLKALKLSAAKMHFGINFSKAFKGIRAGLMLNHHHKKNKKNKNKIKKGL